MTVSYSGAAVPLTAADVQSAAGAAGIEAAAIEAVLTVETGGEGGFLSDKSGRMRILFEAHIFSERTKGKWDHSFPTISSAAVNYKLYKGGAAEYDRLTIANGLDPVQAPECASWGLFQIMGMSYAACGFSSVEAMITAWDASEKAQLDGFIAFCRTNHLLPYLQSRSWAAFAARYNGPDYAVNHYDSKLAAAYAKAKGAVPLFLHIGATGPKVTALQNALIKAGVLDAPTDGAFGRVTDIAVMTVQKRAGLDGDGVVGPATAKVLGL